MWTYEIQMVFWQLLLYGVHLGHSFRNSHFYAGWFIFTHNVKMYIINMYKTLLGFRNGFLGYDFCCKVGLPVWFLNLNRAFEVYVNDAALRCGEFSYATYWIHGMISNYNVIANTMVKLAHYTSDAHKGQFAKLEMDNCPWFFSRFSWPRAVLISSVNTSEWPSKECINAKVPSVGICDTNISGHISNIATPGNDDSIDAQVYYNTSTSQYLLEKKYNQVAGWWSHVRKRKRFFSFAHWILRNFVLKSGIYDETKALKMKSSRERRKKITDRAADLIKFHRYNYFGKGMKFFFAPGLSDELTFGDLDIYDPIDEDKDSYDYAQLMGDFKDRSFYICRTHSFYFMRGLWHPNNHFFMKKKYKTLKFFKLKFLTKVYKKKEWVDNFFDTNFLINRFWRNRVYLTYFRKRRFRKNKFLLKYFKFWLTYRYNKVRGFFNSEAGTYLKKSSFAKVALNYGVPLYKNIFQGPLFKPNILSIKLHKKNTFLLKWLYFKRQAKIFLSRIVYSHKDDFGFSQMFKLYGFFKYLLRKKYRSIYAYFNFYFSFWYWNRGRRFLMKRHKNRRRWRRFRMLKHMGKLLSSINIFKKALEPFKNFKCWYLFKGPEDIRTDVLDISFAGFYKMMKHDISKFYFIKSLKHRFEKVRFLKRYFRKFYKTKKWQGRKNRVIHALAGKYKRFKRTNFVRRKVKRLLYPIKRNKYIEYYRKKAGARYKVTSFKTFVNIYKKYNIKLLRMSLFKNLKYKFDWNFQSNLDIPWLSKTKENVPHFWIIENYRETSPRGFVYLFNKFIDFFSLSAYPYHLGLFKYDFNYFKQNFRDYRLKNLLLRYKKAKTKAVISRSPLTFAKSVVDLRRAISRKAKRVRIFLFSDASWRFQISRIHWFILKKHYSKYSSNFFKLKKKYSFGRRLLSKTWRIKLPREMPKSQRVIVPRNTGFIHLRYQGLKFFFYLFSVKLITIFQKHFSFRLGNIYGNNYRRKSKKGKVKYVFWF